jgi:hypothetical protein
MVQLHLIEPFRTFKIHTLLRLVGYVFRLQINIQLLKPLPTRVCRDYSQHLMLSYRLFGASFACPSYIKEE